MRKLITCVYCAAFVAVVCAVDAYGVLEVSRNASPDEIKQSYKRLAKQWYEFSFFLFPGFDFSLLVNILSVGCVLSVL